MPSVKSFQMPAALLALLLPVAAQTRTNVTFAYIHDTHVTFDGTNDFTAFAKKSDETAFDSTLALIRIFNETAVSRSQPQTSYAGCRMQGAVTAAKSLCEQIQLVRKLNDVTSYLPTLRNPDGSLIYRNTWPSSLFGNGSRQRRLSSAGMPISSLRGVLIGGDLTDCAGGSKGECDPQYTGVTGAQTAAFQSVFDRSVSTAYRSTIRAASFLPGLTTKSSDIPLRYPIYPVLGNHDQSHWDINDGTSELVSYIKTWRPDATGDKKVTSRHDDSGSYSIDWGGLHIIMAGVYPGSDARDYDYSESAMEWFKNDLATYASDGRPVLIVQHFGFDTNWSRTDAFWMASSRVEAYNKLWSAIRNYNIIGFLTGHDHSTDTYTFPDAGTASHVLPYDVLRPGAAYGQRFALVRVTDQVMDVAYSSGNDYDGSGSVSMYPTLTKRLVRGPKTENLTATLPAGTIASASVTSSLGKKYIVTATGTTVRLAWLFNNGLPGWNANQSLPAASTSLSLRPVRLGTGIETYLMAVSSTGTELYKVDESTGTPALQRLWQANHIKGYNVAVTDGYILVEAAGTSTTLDIYRFDTTGVNFVRNAVTFSTLTNAVIIPHTFRDAAGALRTGFIRQAKNVLRPSANVEFYQLNTADPMNVSITKFDNTESWPQETRIYPIPMADGSTQLLIRADLNHVANTTWSASPYHIRTFVDGGGATDVSWRGLAGVPYLLMQNVVPLGFTAEGHTQVAFVSSDARYSRFLMQK